MELPRGDLNITPSMEAVICGIQLEGTALNGEGAVRLDALLAGGVLLHSSFRGFGGGGRFFKRRWPMLARPRHLVGAHSDRGATLPGGNLEAAAVHLKCPAGANGVPLGLNGVGAIR